MRAWFRVSGAVSSVACRGGDGCVDADGRIGGMCKAAIVVGLRYVSACCIVISC